MPKGGKRKGGKSGRRRNESESDSESGSSYDCNASEVCSLSESKSHDDDRASVDSMEETLQQEQFEDKMRDVLDNLAHKSSQGRVTALQNMFRILRKGVVPDFIHNYNFTIFEAVERSLKKGGTAEKIAAADLAPAIYLHLRAAPSANTILPVLKTLVIDHSISPMVRAKCCSALSSIEFLIIESEEYTTGNEGEVNTLSTMKLLRSIFSASCLKPDGTVPNVAAEVAVLHAAAIDSWTLLLTTLHPRDIETFIEDKTLISLKALSELLESPHLEVSLAAGEALAVIFEAARDESENFADDLVDDLIVIFKKLSTGSHKHRTKKDRKQQRATFRDILQYFEDDIAPLTEIKFNDCGRKVELGTWPMKKQYDILCHLFGPQELRVNALLRSIFDVKVPPPGMLPPDALKEEKEQLKLKFGAAAKAKSKARSKQRDKRADFCI